MDLQLTQRNIALAAVPMRPDDRVIETSIPARLDNLRWSGFHTRIVLALGITWILDGLEVTLAGALSGALKESPALRFSNFDIGVANSAYLAGAVLGAGIGGEYTAINSTIQELVPARYRGWTDLVINGSFWIGAAMGAVAAIV